MVVRSRRVSSPYRLGAMLVVLSATLACGSSHHQGNSAPAGKGGATVAAGAGGTSSGSPATAGQASGNGGTTSGGGNAPAGMGGVGGGSGSGAGGAGLTGAGGSSGGGEAGRATGGAGASGGIGGIAQGGTDEGGANDGGAPNCVLGAPPQTCDAVSVQGGPAVDFARYLADGSWSTEYGLTGTTSLYQSPSAPNVVFEQQPPSSLNVSAAVRPRAYAGWVFVFDQCVDADLVTGLFLTLNGDLGGARLFLSVEFDADYPIDVESGKGACSFTSCETIESECKAPSVELTPTLSPDATSTAWWGNFSGGVPLGTPSSDGGVGVDALRGLKFELRCERDTECDVNLVLGGLSYMPFI